jgi:hypothetical protein
VASDSVIRRKFHERILAFSNLYYTCRLENEKFRRMKLKLYRDFMPKYIKMDLYTKIKVAFYNRFVFDNQKLMKQSGSGVRRTRSLKEKAREVKALNSTTSSMGSGIINRSNSLKDKSSKAGKTSHTRLVI